MTTRQFTSPKGDIWEWEETPEVVAAVEQLHKTIKETERRVANLNLKRPHNYSGPLYAPHPDIKKLEVEAAPDYGVGK